MSTHTADKIASCRKPLNCFIINCEWRRREGVGGRGEPGKSNVSLCSPLFIREGGGGRWWMLGFFWGGGSMISKSQGLSFSHVVSFFIPGLIFHWRASSIHLNLLFLALRKLMNFQYLGTSCVWVHALMLTRRVCVCEASVSLSLSLSLSLSVCARGRRFHGCFRSLYLTVRQSEGEPGGARERERVREGERWRDNGNGGWKKANTIFNEFPWLSLPISGSGSPGWGCGWTEGPVEQKRTGRAKVCSNRLPH